METLVVRYGEIGLKGKNRSIFENALVRDMKGRLKNLDKFKISKFHGRIYVDHESYDYDDAVEILTTTFGIVSVSPVTKCEVNMESMYACAKIQVEELIKSEKTFTFKVGRSSTLIFALED